MKDCRQQAFVTDHIDNTRNLEPAVIEYSGGWSLFGFEYTHFAVKANHHAMASSDEMLMVMRMLMLMMTINNGADDEINVNIDDDDDDEKGRLACLDESLVSVQLHF